MKYSLKDFRRAAGRHVDDMEMSPAGRARLVKPIKRRRSPAYVHRLGGGDGGVPDDGVHAEPARPERGYG